MANTNVFVNETGTQPTFEAGANLVSGFVKFDSSAKVINTSVDDDQVDGFITNAYSSGDTNVVVYRKPSIVRIAYDGSVAKGDNVTASGTTAGACKTALEGETARGVVVDVYTEYAHVWLSVGNATVAKAATQDLVADGDVDVVSTLTTFDTTAEAISAGLADGNEGQEKILIMVTDGGNDAVVTPSNLANGTTITFADANDAATLRFTNGSWFVVSLNGVVVA